MPIKNRKRLRLLSMIIGLFLITESLIQPTAIAAREEYVHLVHFTVLNRNDAADVDVLIQRGVPLPKGKIYSAENIFVMDVDKKAIIVTQTEEIQYYDDGSIEWMSFAFYTDFAANETKSFDLIKCAETKIQNNPVKVEYNNSKGISLKNQDIQVDFDGLGVSAIWHNGKNILSSNGIRLFAQNQNGLSYLKNGTVEIYEQGPVYTSVKISGDFGKVLGMRAHQIFRIPSYGTRIHSEVTFEMCDGVINGYDTIKSFGYDYALKPGFEQNDYAGENAVTGLLDENLFSCDYMSAYDESANTTFAVASPEIEKYSVFENVVQNGFKFSDNSILFYPMMSSANYKWYDGVSRTFESDIYINKGRTDYAQSLAKSVKLPPAVTFDGSVFMEAGLVDNVNRNDLFEKQNESVVWLKDKTNQRFDAGAIPYNGDMYDGIVSGFDVRPGEVMYNLWYAYMINGDAELYDVIDSGAKVWSDVVVYRGALEFCRGLGRYRITYSNEARFLMTQPYYDEFSGIIMSYLMTGNKRFYDTAKLMADASYRNATELSSAGGFHVPRTFNWDSGQIKDVGQVEIRYSMHARGLYMAYKLFDDEKYLQIVDEIIGWVEKFQTEEGWWYQARLGDGTPYAPTGAKKPPVKNYIMLYGLRGICDVYREKPTERVKNILVRFADYLIDEKQPGGWLWDTTSDKELCETSEDGARGRQPMNEVMAAEIMQTVYDATKDDKYLAAMLEFIRCYISETLPSGMTMARYNDEAYLEGLATKAMYGQNLCYMYLTPRLYKTISENADTVIRMGYKDLYEFYINKPRDTAYQISNPYDGKEFLIHKYTSGSDEYVYIANMSGYFSKEWSKNVDIKIGDKGSVYAGMINEIDSSYSTRVKGTINYYDMKYLYKIPITVRENSYPVEIMVKEYTDDEVQLELTAKEGNVYLDIDKNLFGENVNYEATVENKKTGVKTVTIKRGKGEYAGNSIILVPFDSVESRFDDIAGKWYEADVKKLEALRVFEAWGNKFSANEYIDAKTFLNMAETVFKTGAAEEIIKKYSLEQKDKIKMNEALDVMYDVLSYKGKQLSLDSIGVQKTDVRVPGIPEDNKTAALWDIELLNIDEPYAIKNNIPLPKQGFYGSKITWRSSDENIVKSNGIVIRPSASEGDKKVILTACADMQGEAVERDIELNVLSEDKINISSGTAFDVYKTEELKNGEISFIAKPNDENIDVTFSFVNAENDVTAHAMHPIIIRFNANGYIDVINGQTYEAIEQYKYGKDTEYHFRLIPNFEKQTFSVYVCARDDTEHTIAEDFKFRDSAEPIKSINAFVLKGTSEASGATVLQNSAFKEQNTKNEAVFVPDYGYQIGSVRLPENGVCDWISQNPDVVDKNGKIERPVGVKDTYVSMYLIPKELVSLINNITNNDKASDMDVLIRSVALRIIQGDADGRILIDDDITNAQAAAILRRFIDACKD